MLECFVPGEFTKVESLHVTQLIGFILEVDHSLKHWKKYSLAVWH